MSWTRSGTELSQFLIIFLPTLSSHVTFHLFVFRIQYLRHIRDFFQVLFKVDQQQPTEEEEDLRLGGEKLILTCVGVGFSNVSKAIM